MRVGVHAAIGAGLIATLATAAQAEPRTWTRDHWTTRQGLPQNSITDIAQGPNGYIWLSTYGGLVRFDGLEFSLLDPVRTGDLRADRFLSVEVGADGALWAGSEGAGLYRIHRGTATRLGPTGNVWDIVIDDAGVVWAAVDATVIRVTDSEVRAHAVPDLARRVLLLDDGVAALSADGRTTCIEGACAGLPGPPPGEGIQAWLRTASGGFVAGTTQGVFQHREGRWRRVWRAPAGVPVDRAPSCEVWLGEVWCAYSDVPVRLADGPGVLTDRAPQAVTRTFVDREGGLWIGLDGQGVTRLQRANVRYLGPDRSIVGVVEAPASEVWTMYFAPTSTTPTNPWPAASTIWQQGPGVALGVTPEGEVIRRSEAGMQPVGRVPPSPPEPPGYLAPALGPWLALGDALFHVGPDAVTRQITAKDLGARTIRPLRGDAEHVWIALDDREVRRWPDGPSVSVSGLSRIRDVRVIGDQLWLASYGDGLVLAEGSKIVGRLTPDLGGCDAFVSHLFDLGDGRLWMNTNRGVGRVGVREATAAIREGELARCGLIGSREGNGNQGLVSSRGEILAPTIRGVARVRPDRLPPAPAPQLDLRTAVYGDEDLLRGGVARGPDDLRVEFAAPYFRDPYAVRYRYRLVGLGDSAWSRPRRVHTVHFQNLAPGDYALEAQVRGLTAWSAPVRLPFTRHPTFWERPVARYGIPGAIVVLVVTLLAVGLVGTRRRAAEVRREMTARLRAQQELQRQLAANARILQETESARRLEALGRLAGGIAHDFNNLLTVVAAHAAMLADHEDPAVQDEAAGLDDVVERGAAVARGLLLFGRPQSNHGETLDLGRRVQEIVPLLRRLIRADLVLDLDCEPGCAVGMASGRVDQVISNLVLNARDAIEGPGTISLTVTRDGDAVVLRVEDDGKGMTEAQRAQALEPYYTTKPLGEGTGLGLSTVHGLVRDAGGELSLDSTLGQGTTVTVRLPGVAAPEAPATAAPAPLADVTLHVLVVEDRAEVRRGLQSILQSMKWTGDVVGTLPEALTAAYRRTPDLVLCDVVMPQHHGPEVRDAIQARYPAMPVLFMSGYVDPSLTGLRPDDVVLRKPFTPRQLADAVAKIRSTTTSA